MALQSGAVAPQPSVTENAKDCCLEALIQALQVAKEEARLKAKEELAATREEPPSVSTEETQEKETESTQLVDKEKVGGENQNGTE